jgi:hypothetical protein
MCIQVGLERYLYYRERRYTSCGKRPHIVDVGAGFSTRVDCRVVPTAFHPSTSLREYGLLLGSRKELCVDDWNAVDNMEDAELRNTVEITLFHQFCTDI